MDGPLTCTSWICLHPWLTHPLISGSSHLNSVSLIRTHRRVASPTAFSGQGSVTTDCFNVCGQVMWRLSSRSQKRRFGTSGDSQLWRHLCAPKKKTSTGVRAPDFFLALRYPSTSQKTLFDVFCNLFKIICYIYWTKYQKSLKKPISCSKISQNMKKKQCVRSFFILKKR